jgi:hypothetical protein
LHTINEKGIAVDALLRCELQILSRSEKEPTALRSTFPIEETDQFGFQDPPALARLGGPDATIADVFEEGRLSNPQVLTGFLGRQHPVLFVLSHYPSHLTQVKVTRLKMHFLCQHPSDKKV